jgi:probable blue pigment (indigoidine) exporter
MSATGVSSPPRAWMGIGIALGSAAAFAVANSSTSLAYEGGSNPLTVALARFALTTIVLAAWLVLSRVRLSLTGRNMAIAASLGLISGLYSWSLLRSFSSIPFALAILIFYLFPLISAAIAVLLGWEKLDWKTVAAIALAFIGVALALGVRGGNLDVWGVMWAFIAAVCWGVVVAVSSHVFGKGDARPLTLHMMAVASASLLMVCVASGGFALPQTASGWTGFFVAAALYGFAIIAFFVAISIIGPLRTSVFAYADAVISAGLGVIVLGQALTLVQVAGIAMVIVALVSATLRRPQQRAGRQTRH